MTRLLKFYFCRDSVEKIHFKSKRKQTKSDKYNVNWQCDDIIDGIPSLKQYFHEVAISENGLLKVNCFIDAVCRVLQSLEAHHSKSSLPTDKDISLKIQDIYSTTLKNYAAECTDDFGRILLADQLHQSENGLDVDEFLAEDEDIFEEPGIDAVCMVPYGAVSDTYGTRDVLCGEKVLRQCSERKRSCFGMYFCNLCANHSGHYCRLFSEDYQNEQDQSFGRWQAAKMDGLL
jgi:hypothetical protein